jgi:protein SCO1/2
MRFIATCTFACLLASIAAADGLPRPPALDRIGVDERVGERVPLEAWFSDAIGRRVQLGELFTPSERRPVLLVLSYVRCRMLCSLVLRGATDAIAAMPLVLGQDYRFVVVSIDPREDAASAAARGRELRTRMGERGDGLQYLVGAERPIRALAKSLGFRYAWDAGTEQFAHPAVVFVLTPDGTIARYVHGVQFEPGELAAALRGAANGERGIAASIGESVLGCFRFDPAARAHREMIESYLGIGAAALSLTLGLAVLWLFLWERRRRRVP